MPRNNDDFITGTYSHKNERGGIDIFHGTGENALGTQSGAFARIKPPHTDYTDSKTLAYNDRRHSNDEFGPYTFPRDEGGQGILFRVDHTPPKVDLLYSTKDARHHAPGLVAKADELSRLEFGESPEASTNLSKNSINFVNRLKRAGLASGPEVEEVENTENWSSAHNAVQSARGMFNNNVYDTTKHPEGENERMGRGLVTELLKREKSLGITPQGGKRKIFSSSTVGKVADKAMSQQFLPGMVGI